MRRRALLQSMVGGTAALGLPGTATARRSGLQSPGNGSTSDEFVPMGSTRIEGCAEVVTTEDATTAFVAADTGFASVDVTDPSRPRVLAEVRDVAADHEEGPLRSILDVKLDGDRLLVSGPAQAGERKGLVVYDVSDPADPTPATEFYPTRYGIHNAYLADGYAYLTNNLGMWRPLTIVDVSSRTPTEVGRWSPRDYDPPAVDGWHDLPGLPWSLHDVYVQGDYAYCAYWDAGTWIVDVSDPADPTFVSRVGDYSIRQLVEFANQSGGGNLWELSMEGPGNDHYVAVDETGETMAVGGEGWDVPDTEASGPVGITLYDVSDVRNPERLATIDPPEADDASLTGTWVTAHNFDLYEGRLFSAWYQGGVKVHDVSDPANPRELAWWRDPENVAFWGTAARSDEFFLASSYHRDVELQEVLFTFPNPGGDGNDASTTATGTTTGSETTDPGDGEPNGTTPAGDGDAATTRSVPGFGVGAAAVGLGVGVTAWLRRRSR